MGPRLGSRGKAIDPLPVQRVEVALQWGRDLEVAESRRRIWFEFGTFGFNGAATWKSRKGVSSVCLTRGI